MEDRDRIRHRILHRVAAVIRAVGAGLRST
jgi:hypothetical protein